MTGPETLALYCRKAKRPVAMRVPVLSLTIDGETIDPPRVPRLGESAHDGRARVDVITITGSLGGVAIEATTAALGEPAPAWPAVTCLTVLTAPDDTAPPLR
jgi:hypothetical protein